MFLAKVNYFIVSQQTDSHLTDELRIRKQPEVLMSDVICILSSILGSGDNVNIYFYTSSIAEQLHIWMWMEAESSTSVTPELQCTSALLAGPHSQSFG